MAKDKNLLTISANAFNEIKAWKTATFVVGAVAAVLAFALISSTKNTPIVLLPHQAATDQKMTVPLNGEIKGTSVEYLANTALSDLSLILNFTPDNVLLQHQRFLNRVTEELYGLTSKELMAQAASLKTDDVTQSFYPQDVQIKSMDNSSATMTVTGKQIRFLAGKTTMRSDVKYEIKYKMFKGYLHVADLKQINKNQK